MLDFFVFFFCALLTGLGIGSGDLLIVYLTSVNGLSQISAGSTNLIFFIAAAAISTCFNIYHKRILGKILAVLAITGACGAVMGSLLASSIGDGLLKKLFGGLLIIMGAILIFQKKKE